MPTSSPRRARPRAGERGGHHAAGRRPAQHVARTRGHAHLRRRSAAARVRRRRQVLRRWVVLVLSVGLVALAVDGLAVVVGPWLDRPGRAESTAGSQSEGAVAARPPSTTPVRSSLLGALPLGPSTRATIPDEARQVVIVRGDEPGSSTVTVALWEDTGEWSMTALWHGHIGKEGWTDDHHEGDLRTPVGTFTLSDAGGRLKDPGSRMPYHRSEDFVAPESGRGFGDSTVRAFDYVLAIDFNRVPGSSPLDPRRPDGWAEGGGIWLHVDHNGPTHGCVSIPRGGMRQLLLNLRPERHPVVVMGDAGRLDA